MSASTCLQVRVSRLCCEVGMIECHYVANAKPISLETVVSVWIAVASLIKRVYRSFSGTMITA